VAQPQLEYRGDDTGEPKSRREDDPELLRRKIARLEGELQDSQDALQDERKRSANGFRAQARLKQSLQPFYQALQMIFGDLEDVEVEPTGESAAATGPISERAYQAWKERLPPACGKIIDALLVQPLTITQISSMCKMHYDTASKALGILSKNGLIQKNGNLNQLRRL
jgi:hypothetical protein